MAMFNPPHPGETLREDVLPALGLDITNAAEQLGVSRQTLSAIVNGRSRITPEFALRIERWLGVDHGGSADVWLKMQEAHDLWKARAELKSNPGKLNVKPFRFNRRTLAHCT